MLLYSIVRAHLRVLEETSLARVALVRTGFSETSGASELPFYLPAERLLHSTIDSLEISLD